MSKACSVPYRFSSPKMLVSFESVSVAPSPRSSRATLIWSAARTNPITSSCNCLPSLPASCASLLRSSRLVRVSIFLNCSLSTSTCDAAIPVNFLTFAISASISAYAFTAERPAIITPVMAAAAPASVVCQSFILRLKRSQKPSPSRSSALRRSSSLRTWRILAVCAFQASLPRSMPLSCLRKVFSVRCNSLGLLWSRRRIVSSTPWVADSICRICALVCWSSF